MKLYSYHVVYHFQNEDGNGFGSIHYGTGKKIKNNEGIQACKKFVEKECGFKNCIILNYIYLGKDDKF